MPGPTWSSTSSESTCAAVQEACAKLRSNLAPVLKSGKDARASWLATIAATQQGQGGYVPSSVMLSAYGWFDGKERSGALLHDVFVGSWRI